MKKKNPYVPNDINQHLFTWSPMNLGNLFVLAGYRVIFSKEINHRFPPKPFFFEKFGMSFFDFMCKISAYLRPNLSQVMVYAIKD